MAREIRSFDITIPAGTTITDGWSQALSMPPRVVSRIDAIVPAGPRGNMGFAIGASGVPIIPYNPGQWIVADDDKFSWPLEGQIDSGGWEFFGYNLGTYAHTVYLTFLLDPVTGDPPSYRTPLAV